MDRGAVLVTGGAKRIGRAISLRLAADGYSVAVHYFSSEDDATEVVGQIIAVDHCDHSVAQPHPLDGLGQFGRFLSI